MCVHSSIAPMPRSPHASRFSIGPCTSYPKDSTARMCVRVSGCPNMSVFIAGNRSVGVAGDSARIMDVCQRRRTKTLSHNPLASLDSVFASHGATSTISAHLRSLSVPAHLDMQHGIADLGKRRPLFSVCPKTHAGRAPAVTCSSPRGVCRRKIMNRVMYTVAIERL